MVDKFNNAPKYEELVPKINEIIDNLGGGGGGSITVDDELSTTSENPVQNKVITSALDDKQDELVAGKNIKIVEAAEIIVPSEYQQLNYIYASSAAMIKTGITGSVQWELIAKSYVNRTAKFLVSNTNATTNALWFGQTTYYWGSGSRTSINATEKAHIIVNFNLETNNVNGTVNDVSFTYTKAGTAVGDWVLFGSPDGNTTRLFDGELYYACARQNGVVVFEGIPALRLSDGEVGLYDTVSDEFFLSDATGFFWNGDNVYEKESILADLPENNLSLNVYGMPKAYFQVGGSDINADISPTVLPKELTVSPLNNSSIVKPLYSLLFCGSDNLIHSHEDTNVAISLQYGMFTNNREFVANSAPNYYNKCERCAWVVPDSLRTLQAKQKVYARCTYPDSSGNVYFIDIVGQDSTTNALGGGYTYFYLGVASTATYVAFNTTGSHFISIDINGKVTHIDGAEVVQPTGGGGASRNIGEIVASTIPLTDAGLHLLDGALLQYGIYQAFIDYIADIYDGGNYPDLFDTEANWQSAVAQYGVCGKFVYNSTNNTLRLPKITGIIEGTNTISNLGDLVEAGLPNITGSFEGRLYGTPTGCFSQVSTSSYVGASSSNGIEAISLDASNSSSIYGNSTTVQPQTIKVLYYIVVATSTKTDIEVDIDEIATDLNGKADKDLGNIDSSVAPIDGEWVPKYLQITTAATAGSRTHDLSTYLPTNDDYLVLMKVYVTYGSATAALGIGSIASPYTNYTSDQFFAQATVSTNSRYSDLSVVMPVSNRTLYTEASAAFGAVNVVAYGYRRLGTNT